MFGRREDCFVASREASCHHTLRWMPFFKWSLASSWRYVANNFFICSSRPRYSHLVAASWSWKCNCARNEKGLRNALRITFHVGGAKALRRSRPGSSCYKMWVGLNGFDPNWLWGMKRATLLSRNPLCWQFEHIPDIVLPMATYQSLDEESSVSPHCFPETLGAHIPNVLLPTTEMKGRSCFI